MAKLKMKNLPIMGTVGAVAGGVAGGYALKFIKNEKKADSIMNNDFLRAGILAGVGVAAQVFVKNDIVAGVGNGLCAVAGVVLAQKLMTNYPVSVSGLPSQRAIGNLPSQRAIGSSRWVDARTVSVPSTAKKVKNVQ